MTEAGPLLAALQHGDSFFPSGSFAFSWGLETLVAEAAVTTAVAVERFASGQLVRRWATCDRPALVWAHRAGAALDRVAEIDREIEALSLPASLRAGSRRAGAALLGVHRRLGTPHAAAYRARVHEGHAPGHAAVVQGLVWGAAGLDEAAAAAVSAHAFTTGIAAAALRLGVISHLDAQRMLGALRAVTLALLATPLPTRPHAFAPAAEIAMMRHECRDARLFAN